MNGFELFKAMNGTDEKYLETARNYAPAKKRAAVKPFKLMIGFAAAAALMIPVGSYAYDHLRLTHREKVSIYYTEDGAQKLEENGLVNGRTVENGQIRLTVDTEMCDGNFTQGVLTLTALTEDAKAHLESGGSKLVYADTGEVISPTGGGFEGWNGEAHTEFELTRTFTFPVKNSYIDSSRPIRLEFYEFVETGETDDYGGRVVVEDYTYFHDISFDLLTTPNVPTKMLYSDNGGQLTLSAYGVSEQDENWAYPEDGHEEVVYLNSFVIISTDGERIDIEDTIKDSDSVTREYSGAPGTGSFTYRFGTILDIDNISGVEINGVEYMAE